MTMLHQVTTDVLMRGHVLSRTQRFNSQSRKLNVNTGRGIRTSARWLLRSGWLIAAIFSQILPTQAQPASAPSSGQILVVEIEGKVEVMRSGSAFWDRAYTNQVLVTGDRLQTGDSSRAVIRLSNLTLLRLDKRSFIEVPREQQNRPILNLLRGALYLFHRDKPGFFPIGTPTMATVVRGTEFNLQVAEDGTSALSLLDGKVEMSNQFGQLSLQSGAAARAEPGKAPVQTAALPAVNVIQWCLYYPGVVDLDELNLSTEEKQALRDSLAAYRSGDLLAAVAHYPAGRTPASSEEKIYLAALDLSVGQAGEAEALLGTVQNPKSKVQDREGKTERTARLADALHKIIAAVKF